MAVMDYLESMDFVTLRQYMLDLAPEDVDSSEGSFLYDAVTPIAMFVAEMFTQMRLILEQSFIGTATGTNLDTLAATMPRVYRNAAVAERLTLRLIPYTPQIFAYLENNQTTLRFSNVDGEFYTPNLEQTDWLTHDATSILVKVIKGAAGNGTAVVGNALEPSPGINGLESCLVDTIDARGMDQEDDDHFRVRVWATLSSPFLGSMADYQRKIFSDFPISENGFNVSNCFIIPRGSRSGYICVIPAKLGSDGGVMHCEQGELLSLQNYLDKRIDGIGGYGLGVAPIGHVVKVRDFSEFRLHQRITIVVARGKLGNVDATSAEEQARVATNNYLRSIINEVVPSPTNYRGNAERFVNLFIYYYTNAHEYAILNALRTTFGADVIKNVTVERLIPSYTTDRLSDFTVSGAAVPSLPLSDRARLRHNDAFVNFGHTDELWYNWDTDGSELYFESAVFPEVSNYIYPSTHSTSMRVLVSKNKVAYAGDAVQIPDLTLVHKATTYSTVQQTDLVIKSGDSKGTLPVIGNFEVEIVEAE